MDKLSEAELAALLGVDTQSGTGGRKRTKHIVYKPFTKEEYSAYLKREERRGYRNDVALGDDGQPIDGGEYVLDGMRLLNEILRG